jgi:5-methylcytosine-specific restriction protein A
MPIAYKSCKCGERIQRNIKNCSKCEAISQKDYNSGRRNAEMQAFYQSKAWWRVRTIVLRGNPLCAVCNHPANVVDHIVESRDGGALLDLNNLQGLCHFHHNQKSAEERKKRGE